MAGRLFDKVEAILFMKKMESITLQLFMEVRKLEKGWK